MPLAAFCVAYQLQGVFYGLGAADIEVHAAMLAPARFRMPRDHRRQLDLLTMQILTGELRQAAQLLDERLVEANVGVPEIDRRIPHLKIEIRSILGVEQK